MFDSNTFEHALLSIFRTLYSFHGLHGVKLVSAGGDAPTKFSKTEGVGGLDKTSTSQLLEGVTRKEGGRGGVAIHT